MLKFSEYKIQESRIDLEDLVLPDLGQHQKIGEFGKTVNETIEKKFQIIKDEVNQHVQHNIERTLMEAGFEIVSSNVEMKSWLTQIAKFEGQVQFTNNGKSFYIALKENSIGLYVGDPKGNHHYETSDYYLKNIVEFVKRYTGVNY